MLTNTYTTRTNINGTVHTTENTVRYNLSTNVEQYTIRFNGWSGKYNIEGETQEHTEFVAYLLENINKNRHDDDFEFECECSLNDDQLTIEFYGQEVIDKAPFFIGEKGDEARGFQLIAHQCISYTVETDEPYRMITNDLLELIDVVEDSEDLFLSYLSANGIEPDDRTTAEHETSMGFTYRFHNVADVSDVLNEIEQQLYGTLADTLLEWTQWYDEWTFTDSHTIDDEGGFAYTWVFTHPPVPKPPQTLSTAQQTA